MILNNLSIDTIGREYLLKYPCLVAYLASEVGVTTDLSLNSLNDAVNK